MKLAKTGFDGIIATDESDNLTTTHDKSITIKQLIKEVFGNTLKHADPSHGYVITAYVNASTLHINASDAPPLKDSTSKHPQDNVTNSQFGNGTGIRSYQTWPAALDSELSAPTSDDQWTLEAAIPLMDTNHADSHHSAGRMRIRLDWATTLLADGALYVRPTMAKYPQDDLTTYRDTAMTTIAHLITRA